MEQKEKQPPNHKEWKSLPVSTRLHIGWIIFKSTQWNKYKKSFEKKIRKIDLWIIPPIAFFGCYLNIEKIFPKNHPMSTISIMGTSFMFATLTMMIVRPKKKNNLHWIKSN